MSFTRTVLFLAELSELSEKYGIVIKGCECGECCGPFLHDGLTHHLLDESSIVWEPELGGYIPYRLGQAILDRTVKVAKFDL